jgi:hypothetical protein
MNKQIERVEAEIGRTKAKIAVFQEKLRMLEGQKTELENVEIVALFRKEKLTGSDLAAFVRSKKTMAQPAKKEEAKTDE